VKGSSERPLLYTSAPPLLYTSTSLPIPSSVPPLFVYLDAIFLRCSRVKIDSFRF